MSCCGNHSHFAFWKVCHFYNTTDLVAAAAAETRKQRAPRPPARPPAPLPTDHDCDTVGGDENNDPAGGGQQQSFIQLTDSKLFANEASNC